MSSSIDIQTTRSINLQRIIDNINQDIKKRHGNSLNEYERKLEVSRLVIGVNAKLNDLTPLVNETPIADDVFNGIVAALNHYESEEQVTEEELTKAESRRRQALGEQGKYEVKNENRSPEEVSNDIFDNIDLFLQEYNEIPREEKVYFICIYRNYHTEKSLNKFGPPVTKKMINLNNSIKQLEDSNHLYQIYLNSAYSDVRRVINYMIVLKVIRALS
ncbi:hypothetical protein DFJ63DRAFT_312769 [Scheffersomyces coipomensis]|uniref:uncharacterized protein n=1 Tax=Scheffersomyces coipomensis TaxID=1788519 RepID=UPI00315CBDAD